MERRAKTTRNCRFDGCTKPARPLGLCNGHYEQKRSGRSMLPLVGKAIPKIVRFWEKVDRRDALGCWTWLGANNGNGWGRFHNGDGRMIPAHRFSYELLVGTVPDGYELDHLCRNRSCVNPLHLEPVTHRENMRRGEGVASTNAKKTHCIHGHPFTPDNTRINKATGHRVCRSCRRENYFKHTSSARLLAQR